MLNNTSISYGTITRSLHWLMAAFFLGMFLVAYIMINIPKSDFRMSLYDLHKATGLLLFALVALRLMWRLVNVQPALPASTPLWQQRAAHWNIVFLYMLMFLMPISGFLTSSLGGHEITFYYLFTLAPLAHDEAWSEFFSDAHEIFSILLIIVFALHVLGSLHHHYIRKDNVMRKMLF
ncbi:MAG: Cytochrome b561 transmembrane protein [uncultured bacterium]|nr:MAG: Cytochrome b561 transmembrane protein [uncultured bacterium]